MRTNEAQANANLAASERRLLEMRTHEGKRQELLARATTSLATEKEARENAERDRTAQVAAAAEYKGALLKAQTSVESARRQQTEAESALTLSVQNHATALDLLDACAAEHQDALRQATARAAEAQARAQDAATALATEREAKADLARLLEEMRSKEEQRRQEQVDEKMAPKNVPMKEALAGTLRTRLIELFQHLGGRSQGGAAMKYDVMDRHLQRLFDLRLSDLSVLNEKEWNGQKSGHQNRASKLIKAIVVRETVCCPGSAWGPCPLPPYAQWPIEAMGGIEFAHRDAGARVAMGDAGKNWQQMAASGPLAPTFDKWCDTTELTCNFCHSVKDTKENARSIGIVEGRRKKAWG